MVSKRFAAIRQTQNSTPRNMKGRLKVIFSFFIILFFTRFVKHSALAHPEVRGKLVCLCAAVCQGCLGSKDGMVGRISLHSLFQEAVAHFEERPDLCAIRGVGIVLPGNGHIITGREREVGDESALVDAQCLGQASLALFKPAYHLPKLLMRVYLFVFHVRACFVPFELQS